MKKFRQLNFGLEASVARQNTKLFDELVALIIPYQEGKRQRIYGLDAKLCQNIIDTIKKHTGITIDFEIVGWDDPYADAMIPATIRTGHIFDTHFYDNFYMKHLKEPTDVTIDLKNARLSGKLTNITLAKIWMGIDTMMSKDVEFPAAVILHELGHCFTFVSTVSYVARGTHLVKETIRQIYDEKDIPTRKVILANKVMENVGVELSEEELDMLVVTKEKDLQIVFADMYNKRKVYGDITNGTYQLREMEQFADMFSVKHGGALAMARWLSSYKDLKKDRFWYNLAFLMNTLEYVFVLIILFPLAPLILLGNENTAKFVLRYDNTYQRIITIRNRLVEDLKKDFYKNPSLRKSTLAQIKELDSLIVNVKNEEALWERGFRLTTYVGMITRKYEKRVEALEKLIYNDLYVRSAQLLR